MVQEHLLLFGRLVSYKEISLLLLLHCVQLIRLIWRATPLFIRNCLSLLRHLWGVAFVFAALLEVVDVHKLKEIEFYIFGGSRKLRRLGHSKPFSFCLLSQQIDLLQSQAVVYAIIIAFAAHGGDGFSDGAVRATLSHLHPISIDKGCELLEMTTVLVAHQTLRLQLPAIFLDHLLGVYWLLTLL